MQLRRCAFAVLWLAAGMATAAAQDAPPPAEAATAPARIASAADPAAAKIEPTSPAQPADTAGEPATSPAPVREHAAVQPVSPAEAVAPAAPADDIAVYYPIEDPPAEFVETTKTAARCPGHPDAIGTSRVITVKAEDVRLLGTIQYKHTLPLNDKEVVLTFDDGPIPPYTNSVLDTLAANCVKATYFLVGQMAKQRPYLVRRIYNEGHSVGTHTQHHPLAIQRLSMTRVEREVTGGIESVDEALGDPKAISPFFRIPGLGRTDAIEDFLGKKGLSTWSADVDTNDWWRGSSPKAIVQRAMARLKAKGRGIILMHDIHPSTALALPTLLKELKEGGYRIVHVVAAGERPESLPEVVASPAEKEIWPRTLHAKTSKSGPAQEALRHRVKQAISKTADRRHHRRHVKRDKADKVDYYAEARRQKNLGF